MGISNIDYISVEKRKVRQYFIFGILLFTFFILLFCTVGFFFIFCRSFFGFYLFKCPDWDMETQKNILVIISTTLAAITVSVFFISGIRDTGEYPINKRKIILIYLSWLIPNIVFPLFLLGNFIPLSPPAFKVSLLLFILSLIILVPYVLIFSHSNRYSILLLWFKFLAQPFVRNRRNVKHKTIRQIKRNIASMSYLSIQTFAYYDYMSQNCLLFK